MKKEIELPNGDILIKEYNDNGDVIKSYIKGEEVEEEKEVEEPKQPKKVVKTKK